MKLQWGQRLIDRIRGKKYLRIYPPYYDEHVPIPLSKPEIYNRAGEKMDLFFLRDRHETLNPYGDTRSRYFLWDRYNYGLDTHFYTGNALMETMGSPARRFGLLIEPRIKQPRDYARVEQRAALAQQFDAILTADARLLDKVDNTLFFPACAAAWTSHLDPLLYQKKTKEISMVSSRKKMCPLHFLRVEVARKCKREGLADTFGTFDGGGFVSYDDVLDDYRYSIMFENEVSPYWYTERLVTSFLKMTVPIYLGATEVGKLFNPDGIIQINTAQAQDIGTVLRQCSEQDYEQRLPAIRENYERAQIYVNTSDLLYESLFVKPEQRTLKFDFAFIKQGRVW